MVEFVDHLVQARQVEGSMEPVMPGVFKDKEQGDLPGHGIPRREGDGSRQAEELAGRVEEPDLRELDGEMREEDEFGAGPLFGQGGHFMLSSPPMSVSHINPRMLQEWVCDVQLGSYTS